MTEINGLRNIIGSSSTLHSLAPEPEREAYDSDAAYEHAHRAWLNMNTWQARIR